MNKRLRELAAQAMVLKEGSMGNGKWCFNKEKFAELIVRECAEFVGKQRNDIPACGFEFEGAIKDHFGV